MYRFYSSGYELRSIASHLRKELLSALVNEGDLAQIHDFSRIDSTLAAVVPTRPQLCNPRTCQLAAQCPSLFFFCARMCDPQHEDFDSPLLGMQAMRQSSICVAIARNWLNSQDILGLLENAMAWRLL